MSLESLNKKYGLKLNKSMGSATVVDRSGNQYLIDQADIPNSANRVRTANAAPALPDRQGSAADVQKRLDTLTPLRDEAQREFLNFRSAEITAGAAGMPAEPYSGRKYRTAEEAYHARQAYDRQLAELRNRYYQGENEQQMKRLAEDAPMQERFARAEKLRGALDRVQTIEQTQAAAPGPMTEEAVSRTVRELAAQYGISGEDSRELSTVRKALEGQLLAETGSLKDAGYDFERMESFRQRQETAREAARDREQTAAWAREHPVLSSLASAAAAPFQAVDIPRLIASGGGSETDLRSYVPADPNAAGITNFVTTVRDTVSADLEKNTDWELFGQNAASFLYNTGMSIGESASQVALLGPWATYLMGASAASQQAVDVLERGGTNKQAFWGGLAAGAAEAVFERFSVEKLLKAKDINGMKDLLRETVKQAGTDASEEMLTEISNILTDAAIMGEQSNFAMMAGQYEAQGLSQDAAKRRALLDCVAQVALAGAAGALSGGVMSGGIAGINAAAGAVSNSKTGAEFRQKLDGGKSIPKGELGRLYRENARSIDAEGFSGPLTEQTAGNAMRSPMSPDMRIPAGRAADLAPLAKTLGESGRKAMTYYYDGKTNAADFASVFLRAYNAGLSGNRQTAQGAARDPITAAAYMAGQNDAAASLTKEKLAAPYARSAGTDSGLVYDGFVRQAVESGRVMEDVNGETRAYLTAETAAKINSVAKSLGVRVQFVDSVRGGTANAQISGSTVLVERNNPNPVMAIVGHEMTHRMQELAPEEYRAFRDIVVQEEQDSVQRRMDAYAAQGVELTYEQAMDEVAADYAGRMIDDGKVLDDFIEKHRDDRTLLEKVRDAIRAIVHKLTGAEKKQAQTAEGKLTAALEAAAQQSERLEANKNAAQTDGEARFSINEQFRQELREWFKDGQPTGERFILGSTGPVLQGLGAIESDIYMNGDKISTILEQHPEMSIREIQRIPEMLEDPTLILKSKGTGKAGNNSRMVLYGSIKAQNGQPVLAVLDLRPRENGFFLNDMQKVNSTYIKNNPASFVTGSDVLYADKKRTVPLLRQFGLTITSRQLLRNGSMGSISYDGDRVKMSGVPFSSVVDLGSGGRFSLKAPVEETRDLLALHNKDERSILAALELGGLPMPSIAVVKATDGHSKYGPISLVFSKDTIDPQADSRNKVYGGDAWTPTSPRVEYEADSAAAERLHSKFYELAGRIGYDKARPLYDYANDLEETLNRNGGEAGLLEKHRDDTAMMNLFLADSGRDMVENINRETVTRLAEGKIALYDHLIEGLGEDIIREMRPVGGETPMTARKRWAEQYGDRLEQVYRDYLAKSGKEGEALSAKQLMPEMVGARNYLANGAETRRTELDLEATRKAIREAVDPAEYEAWLHSLFDGVEGRKGLYNGKKQIDSRGNQRSWGQLHYAYTLENIVKAMRNAQDERGQGFWGVSATGIQALATPSYGSIQDIKADSGRLGVAEGSEYDAKVRAVDDAIGKVLQKIVRGRSGTMEMDYAATALKNAAGGKKTVDAIIKSFAADGYQISSQTAQDIQGIFKAALDIPTGYFEAKPQRVVGFDEVLAAVIPDDSSKKLRDGLAQAGVRTLEYKAGDDADRIAKVNSVEGARFSLKAGTESKSAAALQEENRLLRERVEYWRGQTRRTKRVTTDKKAVARAARELIRSYGADLETGDITRDLQSLYDYLASGYDGKDELTYTEARRRAEAIAEKLVGSAVTVDETYEQYKDLRDYLRTTKLIVSEADSRDIPDYGDWRKHQMGRLNLTRGDAANIDQVYEELSELWPEFFNSQREINSVDQLVHIAEVLDGIYNAEEYNPFETYMQQAITGAANEIMERFFDLPQTRATFADRQARKLDDAKTKGRERVQKLREENAARLAELRQENRERVQKALERERDTRRRQLERLKDRYQARDAAGRERRSAAELRRKITRHAKALSDKLLHPTDKQHIPDALRGPVAALLEAINQESQYTIDRSTGKRSKRGDGLPTKRTEAFRALKEEYAKIVAEGGDMVIDPALLGNDAEGVRGSFDAVIAMGQTRLSDMSTDQLSTVWQVVRAVEHSISTMGRVLSKTKFERTTDWAYALSRGTSSRRTKKSLTKGHALMDLENPYTFFSHYGDPGMDVYRMLRDAQDQQQLMVDQAAEATRKIVSPQEVKQLEETTRAFTTERGDQLTLSTAQIMELYELMKRKQAHDHILKGGVVQPEIDSANIRRGTDAILLTEGDLANITGTLTDRQTNIADELQRLTTGLLADYGNRASMAAYGYKKFTGADYWPIKSAREGVQASVERGGNNTRSIANIGLAKAVVPHASNALDIPGIFSTFASHAGDMIDYAAWLVPMEDASRLYNFRFRDNEGNLTGTTVKGILDRVGGEGSQRYWHNLMEDIQNGIDAPGDSPMWDTIGKGIGSFKGAAVGGNLRVVIQQPTAFFRAAAVLSPADLSRGLAGGVTRGDGWKKALQYAPIAKRKDAGGFDISSPRKMTELLFDSRTRVRRLNDVLSAPAGMADAITWGRLWNACEWATAREHKGLRPGSEAFYQQVNRLFTQVIEQTQVVDGVLQRSNIMRSSNAVVKQATSFMGEPIMSLNMMLRAYDQVRYEQSPGKRGRAIKAMGRAATALVVTNVVNAAAQSIVDAMRDDDEDKKYWERFLSAFTGITGEEESAWDKAVAAVFEGNVGNNLNPLGQIPFVKDVLSLLEGYDVSRTEMEIVSDLVSAARTAADSADGNGKRTRAYAVKQLLAAGAKLFGIPVGNLTRDSWGLMRSITVETDNIPLQYEMEKAIYNISNTGNKGRYYDILFRALTRGDMNSYEHIRRELMEEMGLDGESIDSAMRSRYSKAVKADPSFTMSQQARDLLDIRTQYAPPSEKTEAFGPGSLGTDAYRQYSEQAARTYRGWEDVLQEMGSFRDFPDEAKDKVLDSARKLAEDLALRDASGGRFNDEALSQWERWAVSGYPYGVSEEEAILFKAAYDMTEGDRDKNGNTVTGSKKANTLEAVSDLMPWLTGEELDYLMSNYWTPEDAALKALREGKFMS